MLQSIERNLQTWFGPAYPANGTANKKPKKVEKIGEFPGEISGILSKSFHEDEVVPSFIQEVENAKKEPMDSGVLKHIRVILRRFKKGSSQTVNCVTKNPQMKPPPATALFWWESVANSKKRKLPTTQLCTENKIINSVEEGLENTNPAPPTTVLSSTLQSASKKRKVEVGFSAGQIFQILHKEAKKFCQEHTYFKPPSNLDDNRFIVESTEKGTKLCIDFSPNTILTTATLPADPQKKYLPNVMPSFSISSGVDFLADFRKFLQSKLQSYETQPLQPKEFINDFLEAYQLFLIEHE